MTNPFEWRNYDAQVYKEFLKKPNANGGKGWMTTDSIVLSEKQALQGSLMAKSIKQYNLDRANKKAKKVAA